MNETELLDLAAKAINCRNWPQGGRFAVGFYQGEIRCLPVKKLPGDFILAEVYTTKELKKGLTGAQWLDLQRKLRVIFRRIKL